MYLCARLCGQWSVHEPGTFSGALVVHNTHIQRLCATLYSFILFSVVGYQWALVYLSKSKTNFSLQRLYLESAKSNTEEAALLL